MIFNNYIIIKIPILEENFDFYEIQIEAGGDYSAAWCEIYFPKQSMQKFHNALNGYAQKYDKPLHYDLDETVSFCFSKHSRTGSIDVDIDMNKYGNGYSKFKIQTNITEMDSFINGIGKMLNGNSNKAFIGSEQSRFI